MSSETKKSAVVVSAAAAIGTMAYLAHKKGKRDSEQLTNKSTADRLVFQLGTTNWQVDEEPATGSGILHQHLHKAMNSLPNTKCYSLYPSNIQTSHPDPTVDVCHLPHPLPICEGIGPLSKLRWHTFTDEGIQEYRDRMEQQVYDWMEQIEAAEGTHFSLAVAHHAFLTPVMMLSVLRRRCVAGKPPCRLGCFLHGTGLKMYENELSKAAEWESYPVRFHPWLRDNIGLFQTGGVGGCWAISKDTRAVFHKLFPEMDLSQVALTKNGIPTTVFHPFPNLSLQKQLADCVTDTCEGSPLVARPVPVADYEHAVAFVGRFAHWKRLASLLSAARLCQDRPEMQKTCFLVVGTAQQDLKAEFHTIAADLGLTHTYFLGPKPQPELAKFMAVADVGVFPSKDEPFGMVFIECMACGTPVIGAASGGPLEFVNASNGHLVPETDDKEAFELSLADAITLAVTQDWKHTKGAAAFESSKKYSIDTQAANMLDFLTTVPAVGPPRL